MCMKYHQAAIFFEATHVSRRENVQRVDALVEQASIPLRPDGSPGLLVADREEISSIYLEVGWHKAEFSCTSARFYLCCIRQSYEPVSYYITVSLGGFLVMLLVRGFVCKDCFSHARSCKSQHIC